MVISREWENIFQQNFARLLSGRLTTTKKLRVYSIGLLSYELPKIQAAVVSAILNPPFFIATRLYSSAILKIVESYSPIFTKKRQNFGSSPYLLMVCVWKCKNILTFRFLAILNPPFFFATWLWSTAILEIM